MAIVAVDPTLAVFRRRTPGRPHPDERLGYRPRRLHPFDGDPGFAGRAGGGDPGSRGPAGRLRLPQRARGDRGRGPDRAGDRFGGGFGRRRSGPGVRRRHPGDEGRPHGDRRHLRREQVGSSGRRPPGPGPRLGDAPQGGGRGRVAARRRPGTRPSSRPPQSGAKGSTAFSRRSWTTTAAFWSRRSWSAGATAGRGNGSATSSRASCVAGPRISWPPTRGSRAGRRTWPPDGPRRTEWRRSSFPTY